MVPRPLHETIQGRPATAIRIPVALCGAPAVKTKILSAQEKGAWMQAPNRGLTERSGEVFLLDILSHRMSEIGMLQQLGFSLDRSSGQKHPFSRKWGGLLRSP